MITQAFLTPGVFPLEPVFNNWLDQTMSSSGEELKSRLLQTAFSFMFNRFFANSELAIKFVQLLPNDVNPQTDSFTQQGQALLQELRNHPNFHTYFKLESHLAPFYLDFDTIDTPHIETSDKLESEIDHLKRNGPQKPSFLLVSPKHSGFPNIIAQSPLDIARLLGALTLTSGHTWVDIGSGNGKTLGQLAQKHSAAILKGFDYWGAHSQQQDYKNKLPNLNTLPSNAQYYIMGPKEGTNSKITDIEQLQWIEIDEDFLQANPHLTMNFSIARTLLLNSASVLSMFYPSNSHNFQGVPPQLKLADYLLTAGGIGIIVTERRDTLEMALQELSKNPNVDQVFYSEYPLNATQLRELGIEPYAPVNKDLSSTHPYPFEQAGIFSWGYPIYFRMK